MRSCLQRSVALFFATTSSSCTSPFLAERLGAETTIVWLLQHSELCESSFSSSPLRVTLFPFWRFFHLHVLFVSRLIVIVSQHQRTYSVTACPWFKIEMINPDKHHVDAFSLVDWAFHVGPFGEKPNCEIPCDGHIHPRTNLSQNSNWMLMCAQWVP